MKIENIYSCDLLALNAMLIVWNCWLLIRLLSQVIASQGESGPERSWRHGLRTPSRELHSKNHSQQLLCVAQPNQLCQFASRSDSCVLPSKRNRLCCSLSKQPLPVPISLSRSVLSKVLETCFKFECKCLSYMRRTFSFHAAGQACKSPNQ